VVVAAAVILVMVITIVGVAVEVYTRNKKPFESKFILASMDKYTRI
jgi:hypothetical protein